LQHAIHVCGSIPLNAKSLPALRKAVGNLLRLGDDDSIRGSFVFLSAHVQYWHSKEPEPIRGFFSLVLEELETYINSSTDPSGHIMVSEATLKGLTLNVGPQPGPPIRMSLAELTVWPSKIARVIDACSVCVSEAADKNNDQESSVIASLLIHISELVEPDDLKKLETYGLLREKLMASTLTKLEQRSKMFLKVPDSLDIARLLSLEPTSKFSKHHLTSLVGLLNESDAYELHRGISFALPLLRSLALREDWNDLLDQMNEGEQREMTSLIAQCFLHGAAPIANLIEVLASCQQFTREAFDIFWVKIQQSNMMTDKYLPYILRIFSRFAIETPLECADILQSAAHSQLRRIFFCLPPTLDSSNIIQDIALRAMLALLQSSASADALLDAMKDEWRSDGGLGIESASFSDADFVSAMMGPLPTEEPDPLVISPPSLEEQRRWLQLVISTLPKTSSKVKMMVMMRLP
jgi:hypothetical protein